MLPELDTINKHGQTEKSKKPAPDPREGFATTVEAADFLSLSRQAISLMVLQGKIPARRYGRSLRIPWDWLYEERQRAREERPLAVVRKKKLKPKSVSPS